MVHRELPDLGLNAPVAFLFSLPSLMSTLPRLLAVLLVISLAPLTQGATELFDGKTLAGWEGDLQWWRIQDGVITGG